ncbi:MAG: hypothetical protein SFU83_02460 [Meiothermus sp.]|nr:hypothetical protein [Meiothermus sp.]
MQRLRTLLHRPDAQAGARLGGKLLLLQILIEIPFLILEASLLVGAASGGGRGLALWQSALLVAAVYLLLEALFFAVQRLRGNRQHRWFESERVMLGWVLSRLRRRGPQG